MSRDEGLAAAITAVVMGGAVAIAIAADVAAPACNAAKAQIGFAKDFDFGCFEFWLNRYQTLFGAIVGIGVAYYVVRPAIAQMRAANKQTFVQLAERAEVMAKELEGEREAIAEIKPLIDESQRLHVLYGDDNIDSAFANWQSTRDSQGERLKRIANAILGQQIRRSSSAEESGARTDVIRALGNLDQASGALSTAFHSEAILWDPEEGVPMTTEEMQIAEQQFVAAVQALSAAHKKFAVAHDAAVARAWFDRGRFSSAAFEN